ncbi:hypothetical protein GRI43_10080 [Altererythrobacter luteolus]|uniref:WD40-like Beta Propeller Repeat n=1 Tax=Pontixanthobacter luteolus TaxID=295089 RepID=A0A6I4V0D3_9SPHN|nr:hypothetical protein [Pontixanthobacter luteolus]MXP47729.1 hypothetical protein [Pontixanthobacter luteolus]
MADRNGPIGALNPSARLAAHTPAGENIFFGFHDISPWSPDGSRLLCLRLDPEWQSMADTAQTAEVCLWDSDEGQITPVGQTECWNFQQAARQQWLPDGSGRIAYNRLDNAGSCTGIIANPDGEVTRHIKGGIYAISPCATWALAPDFETLTRNWPAYGYASLTDPEKPRGQGNIDAGITRIDLRNGEVSTLISLADVIERWKPGLPTDGHFLTHPSISPSGQRIVFLHRFFAEDEGSFTRLISCDPQGRNMAVLAEEKVSHFDWLDDDTLLVWARYTGGGLAAMRASGRLNSPWLRPVVNLARKFSGRWKKRVLAESYFAVDVDTGRREKFGWPSLDVDGHPMVARSHDWLVTDTYPDKGGWMSLILWNRSRNLREDIARIGDGVSSTDSDAKCDLHPRWNRTENQIAVDHCVAGIRRLSIFDVSHIVGAS